MGYTTLSNLKQNSIASARRRPVADMMSKLERQKAQEGGN